MSSNHHDPAQIRARLNHPVIDSDGHSLDYRPALIDHLKAAGHSVDGFDLRARKSPAPIERPGPRPSKVC